MATGLVTGLLTGGIALAGIWLTHRLTQEREKRALKEKLARERYFIATELVFLLEKFGEECVPAATDYGDAEDENGTSVSSSQLPQISFSGVSGDWRSLPPLLMYRLRELEVSLAESKNIIAAAFDEDYEDEPDFREGFFRRRQQVTLLGIRAFILAARLRRLCGMPRAKNWLDRRSAPIRLWCQYREQRAILAQYNRSISTLGVVITGSVHAKCIDRY